MLSVTIAGLVLAGFIALGARVLGNRACLSVGQFNKPRNPPAGVRLSEFSASESRCRPLSEASEAFHARVRLAELADSSLDVQYYGFKNDRSGRALISAVLDATGRGVHVRLLLDDIDLAESDRLFSRLVIENDRLDVRVFNPLWLRRLRPLDFLLRFPRSSRRMHNKSFTADALATIVGGRNIGEEYFKLNTAVSFTDFDVLATGPVALGVAREFDRYWDSRVVVDVRQVARPARQRHYQAWLNEIECEAHEEASETARGASSEVLGEATSLVAGNDGFIVCTGSVHADPPEKVLGRLFDTDGSLATLIRDQLQSATKSLVICSPYFIPYEPGMAVFREVRDRGVDVTVLTNSYAANDVLAVHAGYVDYRKRMLELGVQMYEFKPGSAEGRRHKLFGNRRSSLHAKAFVVDGRRLFVGSFNLDPRSAIHNTELGILLESEMLGSRLSHSFTDRLEEIAYHLTLDEHRLRWRERTGQGATVWHESEPHTTALQRLGIYCLSWLPVEWLL